MSYEDIKDDICKRITTYPWDVLEGRILACEYVKLACRRFDDYLRRDDMYFDAEAVLRVVNFTSKLRHFDSVFAGKPFILSPWQKFIYMGVYGFKWKSNGRRVTRTFILSVARKSGKSSLLSAMALYALFEEKSAKIVTAANSASQAKLLFDMASKYLRSIDPKNKYFKRYRDRIDFESNDAEIKIVSADAERLDGLNLSFYVEDETAAAPDSSVWDVLESSQGARPQPLACSCTTRGFQLNGFYKEMEDSAIEVLRGIKKDDSIFCLIYTLDDGDSYDDERNWIKCSPNYGTSVTKEFMEQQLTKMKNNPSQEYSIKTKIFNQWVTSSDTWIQMKYIFDNMKPVNLEDYKGKYGYYSFDLATTCDLACLNVMIPLDDGEFIFKTHYYLPHDSIMNNPNSERYKRWISQGYLTMTDGNVTDVDYVMNDLMRMNSIVPVYKVSYDQWNSSELTKKLVEKGVPLQPYSQSIQSMNLPTKTLERWIMSGKVTFDKNPITSWCYENAVPKYDWNDNVKIVKNTVMQKIDGVVAHTMSVGGYLQDYSYDITVVGATNA